MVSHHLIKFGGPRHCCSEDKKFIVVEEKGSKCSRFNLQLLFTSKGHGL